MTLTAKLICGARTLNLNSGRYTVGSGFAPPATQLIPLMAGGTSANRHGGAQRVSLSAANRNWTFTVGIRPSPPSSAAEITRALGDLAFMLSLAGDEAEPLYLYYKPDANIAAAPAWGQSGYYYEIAHADVPQPGAGSTLAHLRGIASPGVTVTCELKPYARGQRQRVMSATGGVLEDRIGTVDGRSRGLRVPPATTNKMTNPVFGHATPGTDWTIGNTLLSEYITDPALLPGPDFQRALYITRISGPNNAAYQSINVGNTNAHMLSCLARRLDGAAVTSADATMYYGSAQTTTYRSLGNGWYWLTAAVTGVNAATNTGIVIATNDRSVICTGFQIEELSYATPCAWGDLLGCAWSGTAHASTSTRTLARARLAASGHLNATEGCIRLVWQTDVASTHGAILALVESDTDEFTFYYNNTDDKFYFTVDGVSANTAAQTFAAGDKFVFYLVWGAAGNVIYIAGASAATAAYSVPAVGTYVYLGTSDTPGLNAHGVFLGLDLWKTAPTAAEVAADYANIAPLVEAGERVSAIPWLWTKDGDDVVDNHDDSGEDNYLVAGGMPGSAPADTEYYLSIIASGTSPNFAADGGYFLSLFANDRFYYPDLLETFANNDGTATAATDLNSDVETISVNTTEVGPSSADYAIIAYPEFVYGRQVYVAARLSDAGANLMGVGVIRFGNTSIQSEWRGLSADATRRFFLFGPLVFLDRPQVFDPNGSPATFSASIFLKRSVAGAANVTLDFTMLLFDPLVHVRPIGTVTGLDGTWSRLRGKSASMESAAAFDHSAAVLGSGPVDFEPGQYNTLFAIRAKDGNAYVIDRTLTFSSIHVTPRYALL